MEKISQSVKRLDFDDKISGQALYCSDLHPHGLWYAITIRSTQARARILKITYPKLPKAVFIIDHHDIPAKNIVPIVLNDQPFLAQDIVNYIGEPILLIAGPDRQILNEVASQIQIDYEPLDPIFSIEEAMERKTDFIYGDKATFAQYTYRKGDPDQILKDKMTVIEDTYRTGYQEHVYLEPHSMLAIYKDKVITVYGSMQCPYYIYDALKEALGWDDARLRVIQLPTGGGFGGKEEYPSIPGVHAALCSIKTGHPIQLVLDRQEDINASTKRHPSIIRIRSVLDEHQKIIIQDIDIKEDAGAYAGLSSVVLQRGIFSVGGVYSIPNLKVSGASYATNNIVCGAFRGFGGPQAFFAMERHMEHIANVVGQEPMAFKRRYFLKKGDTSSTCGVFSTDIRLNEITDAINTMSAYTKKRAEIKPGQFHGIGYSVFFHGCGYTGAGEMELLKSLVKLRKNKDETVDIFVSNTEIGQGVLTTLRKIVAMTLGLPLDQIHQGYPDTLTCPNSGPTVASRTTMIVGRLLQDCAIEMKTRWDESEMEISKRYTYPDHLHWNSDTMKGNAYPEYSWGANVVEVTIDPLTYQPNVIGLWAVYDIGTPIDEQIVQGQIEGGFMQGLGYASMEKLTTRQGKLLQDTLSSYMIPTSHDFPNLTIKLIDNPNPDGPYGAKGLGELPLIGVAPAYANAVSHAIGKPINTIPITPEIILEVLTRET